VRCLEKTKKAASTLYVVRIPDPVEQRTTSHASKPPTYLAGQRIHVHRQSFLGWLFCCTLFAPGAAFSDLTQSSDKLPTFFDHHFPGVTPQLISPQSLQAQFIANPHVPIMDIKCSKQQHSNVVIIGDAAYAVQPFYGQGLNAGLEDVRILFDSLDQLQAHRLGGILLTSFNFIPCMWKCTRAKYTQTRYLNLQSIQCFVKSLHICSIQR
jgi:2-polyprenyl-6-methoxyphenol hydroxylase-like FAD-dependent oxidoreductase